MIDTDTVEQILQDETHPDILRVLGLELLAEIKRLEKRLDFAWGVMDDETAVEFNDLILESEGEEE